MRQQEREVPLSAFCISVSIYGSSTFNSKLSWQSQRRPRFTGLWQNKYIIINKKKKKFWKGLLGCGDKEGKNEEGENWKARDCWLANQPVEATEWILMGFGLLHCICIIITILFFPFSSPPFFIIYYYYYYVRGRERKESEKKVWFSEFHIQVGFADMQVAGFGKSGLCPPRFFTPRLLLFISLSLSLLFLVSL